MDGADRLGEPVKARRTVKRRRTVALAAAVLLAGPAPGPALAQEPVQELELVPRASRNVTPPGILPGPEVDGPLYREPVPPPPPEPPRWRRFHLPRTTDAATFVTGEGLVIRIYGVAPPALDRICRQADGEEWPCGRTALFSLRMFLRGRAVECYLPPLDGIDRAIAPCRVGKTDIADWLIRQGWATPDENATDEYREAAEAARCGQAGIWRGTDPGPACDPEVPEAAALPPPPPGTVPAL